MRNIAANRCGIGHWSKRGDRLTGDSSLRALMSILALSYMGHCMTFLLFASRVDLETPVNWPGLLADRARKEELATERAGAFSVVGFAASAKNLKSSVECYRCGNDTSYSVRFGIHRVPSSCEVLVGYN